MVASISGSLHGRLVHPHRVEVLVDHLARLVPRGARVLDVGAGDGLVAATLAERRPDLEVSAVDVLVRADTRVPVEHFDGKALPHEDRRFDATILVDVLHHSDRPEDLLREAARVSRGQVIVKDHLLGGLLAGPTLRFMDRVGNRRHDVSLPHNYLRRDEWQAAFERIGLQVDDWEEQVGLYPFPASLVFERSLHFVARLSVPGAASDAEVHAPPAVSCNDAWEQAYLRFESRQAEIAKFKQRLLAFGAAGWDREDRIVELFCGRGSGLEALRQLGFRNLEGVDLSERLLRGGGGSARKYVADCRDLGFMEPHSRDRVVVHGGLHHLSSLDDLAACLEEARRILRPSGALLVVEPWITPFLSFVHWTAGKRMARRWWPRLDALWTMIEHERETYERWLAHPSEILAAFEARFELTRVERAWGKAVITGRPRA
jgi:SAM-dependent methyltransferase